MDPPSDAEWKRIQRKTFTRWCNEQLKVQYIAIQDLETDLSNGVNMIILLEVLSQKKIGRYNKKPKIHAQKMENVQLALDFITKTEKIRLVNIGSGDIVNSNLKLILGLIWTLILHYQISVGFNIGPDEDGHKKGGMSAKEALMNYIREKIPDKKVNNLTTDWNDGTLVAALVDAHAPGLCPEHATMTPDNALENASHSMKLAEDWLGVPQVLMPEDMVNPKVDELSMMTYLSHYPRAELKPGAPIRGLSDASKVKVYGPGVEKEGLTTAMPSANFTVDTKESGPGAVKVSCEGPKGNVPVKVKDNKDGTYSCSYKPDDKGYYTVKVSLDGQPVKDSPFEVQVKEVTDPRKVKVTGDGLKGGKVGKPLKIDIDTRGAGDGEMAVGLIGPVEAPMSCDDHQDGSATLTFVPPEAGPYTLDVKFGGKEVEDGPFTINVYDPSKVEASGSGVTGPACVKAPAEVLVDTTKAGVAPLSAKVTSPSGEAAEVELKPTDQEGIFKGAYSPKEIGHYGLEVNFADEPIPKSPFCVPVCDPAAVRLDGPGLECAVKDADNVVDVYTDNAGPADVEVQISGPPDAPQVDCYVNKLDDNHQQIHYTPHSPGNYELQVTYGGFPVGEEKVVPCVDPTKVRLDGPGVDNGILVNEPTEFTIDTTEAGPGPVDVQIKDADGMDVPCEVSETSPGNFKCKYAPKKSGNQEIDVKLAGHDVANTPLFIHVSDPGAVRAYGPGLERATAQEPTNFTVDASSAGDGSLGLSIVGPEECEINCEDKGNGIYEVTYTAPRPGIYNVDLKFSEKEVPGSPYEVKCERAPPDASKCVVSGLETPGSFKVDCKDAGGTGLLEVGVCGAYVPVQFVSVQHNGDYTFSVSYDIPEPGETTISVKWHGQHLTGSPFTVVTK